MMRTGRAGNGCARESGKTANERIAVASAHRRAALKVVSVE
jgi:hypothetical protein